MMSGQQQKPLTNLSREDNPKAVFLGQDKDRLAPIARLLASYNIDLYAGNNLADAFFGNYFFYIGDEHVKDFLKTHPKQFPKSLIFTYQVSAEKELVDLAVNLPQIKFVFIDEALNLTPQTAESIMGFFLGGNQPVLDLRSHKPIDIKASKTSKHNLTPVKIAADTSPQKVVDKLQENIEKQLPFIPEETQAAALTKETKAVRNKTEQIIAGLMQTAETSQETTAFQASQSISPRQHGKKRFFTLIKAIFHASKPTGVVKKRFLSIRTSILVASLVAVFALVVFPFITLFSQAAILMVYLNQVDKNIQTGSLAAAKTNLKRTSLLLKTTRFNFQTTSSMFDLMKQRQLYQELNQAIDILEKLTLGVTKLVNVSEQVSELVKGVSGQEKGVPFAQLISTSKGELSLADTELAVAQADLQSEQIRTLFSRPIITKAQKQLGKWSQALATARADIDIARKVLSILPEIIGLYGQRKFLVLFQNNMELRPTGGFIGSYGLLSFEEGVLKEFQVDDVYTADGALKGHIEPPAAISVYLEQEHWYLRDSNWDADFTQSAPLAIWFLDKELGQKVDGVLAIDLVFAQKILQALGQVRLTDYNEEVNAENLFTKAQQHVQTDFFPGSTKKKDFLGSLARTIFNRLFEDRSISLLNLARGLRTSLDEKHALMYFVDPGSQELVESLSWAGKLASFTGCTQACLADFLAVVDANLGVNKVNYFVSKNITDHIQIDPSGEINHQLVINYQNRTKMADVDLGGEYKDYLRVYVPKGSTLNQVQVGQQILDIAATNVASDSAALVNQSNDLTVFEAWIKVPPDSHTMVKFDYQLPKQPITAAKFNYVYQLQKQPGEIGTVYNSKITYPSTWTKTEVALSHEDIAGATSLVETNQITYNIVLNRDWLFKTTFVH